MKRRITKTKLLKRLTQDIKSCRFLMEEAEKRKHLRASAMHVYYMELGMYNALLSVRNFINTHRI
jgi:hypothetical protein